MLQGVTLSLRIGIVPVPVPREVVEALVKVTVSSESEGGPSGFEMDFDLPARSPLRTLFLLTGGGSLPMIRVVLVVSINGQAQSIINGVATNIETNPGDGGIGTLVVKGTDLTVLMNLLGKSGTPFAAMPPAVRVNLILSKYLALGVIPLVVPSILDIVPLPTKKIPQQRCNDYEYIKLLAEEVGHVFYMEPSPKPGISIAYWGPEIRIGQPQPALTTGMDAMTNVESLSFNFDKKSKRMPIVHFQLPAPKLPIKVRIPDVTPLNPPLGLIPPLPVKTESLDYTAKLSAPEALMRGLAFVSQNSDAVFGEGKLDVARYGRLLKARRLVGVRGAGLPYDGLYYVKSVTHEIERGSYKQSFKLARNAIVSTVRRVPV